MNYRPGVWRVGVVLAVGLALLLAGCPAPRGAGGRLGWGAAPASLPTNRPLTLITVDLGEALSPHFFDELTRALPEWSPDVLFFQSVRNTPQAIGGREQLLEWAERTGYDHVYFADAPGASRPTAGNTLAIVARVAATREPAIEPASTSREQASEPLRFLAAEPMLLALPFAWGDATLTLCSARLPDVELLGDDADALTRLLGAVNGEPGPFVLGIQVGTPKEGDPRQILRAEWNDAFDAAGVGLGYTTPNPVPRARAAHFFLPRSGELRAQQLYPLGVRGCPNLPLLVRVDRAPAKGEPAP